MLTQQALHVELSEGRHDVVELASPHFVGPVAYAWDLRSSDDPTVLGAGPLLGTGVPGANGLVIAGRSPVWDGFLPSLMEGAALPLLGLGHTLVALRGRAPAPSVLVLARRGGALEARVEPLDPEPLWKEGGLEALLGQVSARAAGELSSARVLAVGPGAARTRVGAIGSAAIEAGRPSALRGWFRRGGFGSRLWQVHGLCAVVLGSDRAPTLGDPAGVAERFRPGMSLGELEAAVHFEFNPRLLRWGTLGTTFNHLRQRALWFNSSSVHLTEDERDELSREALLGRYLAQLDEQLARGAHESCGEACPLVCRKRADGRLKEFEPYAALGPQLGIVDQAAADRLVAVCERQGLDPVAAGGVLGWLMERLHRGILEPRDVWVSERPRWSARQLDAAADSQHNARLAEQLLEGWLAAPWGEPLRQGLRTGAHASGAASAALAVYNANGDTGEMVPLPFWAPGFLTPMPIAGEQHHYSGLEFVPPRVLGRKSAQRMSAELMLHNFGVCRLHRGWAEDLLPDLVNRQHGTSTDWSAQHRDLAHRIFHRRKARFWETERMIDMVATFLQTYQHDGAADAELDRWVRRFREDRASAARAYWSEINAGIEEILGT